ncbi:ash family protein [Salmonella enterica]|nr:hypothetical protein [Salmonella enterica]EBC1277271.1 hypothetical protein [Salmonella enterica]EBE7296583.1 hypothetical protein [Salmonella enterica]EGP2893289.1 ash family protein [Salmonella enterica]EHT6840669.1 ash family protein [Salmonella enterica]
MLLPLDDGNHNINVILMSIKPSKALDRLNCWCYAYPAPHKTGAGRGNPNLQKATPDAESVFFVVCHTSHSMAWYAIQQQSYNRRSTALLSYHAANNGAVCTSLDGVRSQSLSLLLRTPRRQRMVTLAGQPQGWPVSFCAGISTPVNVTALFERGNSGGDSLNQQKEATVMATTPTRSRPQIVYLPLVDAVDTGAPREVRWIQQAELDLLHRVKLALDRAGVEWIDTRANERSKPTTTSGEGSNNA